MYPSTVIQYNTNADVSCDVTTSQQNCCKQPIETLDIIFMPHIINTISVLNHVAPFPSAPIQTTEELVQACHNQPREQVNESAL